MRHKTRTPQPQTEYLRLAHGRCGYSLSSPMTLGCHLPHPHLSPSLLTFFDLASLGMGVNLSSVCGNVEPRPSPAPVHHRHPCQECRIAWSRDKPTAGAHHLESMGYRQLRPRRAFSFTICPGHLNITGIGGIWAMPALLPWSHSESAGPGQQHLYIPGIQGQCGSYVLEPCRHVHWASSCSQACSRNCGGGV